MEKSIGCDKKTYADLSRIAKKNGFTLIGQIRFWIKGESK